MSFSLSVLILLSLMECQGLEDAPAAHLLGSSSATVLYKQRPTYTLTQMHTKEYSLSWNSKAVFAHDWHYKVKICIKYNDSSRSASSSIAVIMASTTDVGMGTTERHTVEIHIILMLSLGHYNVSQNLFTIPKCIKAINPKRKNPCYDSHFSFCV